MTDCLRLIGGGILEISIRSRVAGAMPPKGREPPSLEASTAKGATTMICTSLAEILLASDAITEEQLAQAGALSIQRGMPLPEVLVQQRFITDDTLLHAQSQQFGLPYWKELPEHEFDVALMTKVPLAFARRHVLVPIRMENGAALVATSQVLAVQPLDDVSMLLQASVEPVLSSE